MFIIFVKKNLIAIKKTEVPTFRRYLSLNCRNIKFFRALKQKDNSENYPLSAETFFRFCNKTQKKEWFISRVLSWIVISLGQRITARLKRSVPGGQRAASSLPIRSCSRRGLPGTTVARRPVSSCLAVSPLPGAETGRSVLCCTFLWLAPTGRYPASCPAEPGLSSPAFAAATIRTTPSG